MQSAMHVLSLWVDNNAYISGKTAKVKTERLFLFEIMAQVLRLSWPYRRTVQEDSTGGQYRREHAIGVNPLFKRQKGKPYSY